MKAVCISLILSASISTLAFAQSAPDADTAARPGGPIKGLAIKMGSNKPATDEAACANPSATGPNGQLGDGTTLDRSVSSQSSSSVATCDVSSSAASHLHGAEPSVSGTQVDAMAINEKGVPEKSRPRPRH
jgi:hypothetical protein